MELGPSCLLTSARLVERRGRRREKMTVQIASEPKRRRSGYKRQRVGCLKCEPHIQKECAERVSAGRYILCETPDEYDLQVELATSGKGG
jgi:hypothetical protein